MAKTRVDITDTLNTWKEKTNDISLDLGDRALLTTDEDSDVVGSINSIDSNLGAREDLTTNDKRSVVQAVNELDSDVGDITTLDTETQASVVRAINELELNHNNLDSDLGGRIVDGRQGNYVRGIKVRGADYGGSPGARNTSSFAVAINDMMDSIGGGRLRTDDQAIKQAINELHDEMHDSGVNFGNFGNSHIGARLAANSLKEAIQEIIDEVGDITRIDTNWTGGTSNNMGSGNHDSSVVGALLALRARVDSVDADIDQPVLTTSGVVFNKTTLGTYPATTTGNAEYTNAGITRSGTGNYTIDVGGDIILDADGNDIIFKNGAGGDQVKHTLLDGAGYTISAPSSYIMDAEGDIYLDANGADIYFKDNGYNRYTFNMGVNQEIDIVGSLILDVEQDIILDADNANIYFKDAGTTHYTFTMGSTDELSVANQFKVDAGGKITLDAHNGVLELAMKDSNHIVFDLQNDSNRMTVDNDFVVDVAGDITLDADGNDIIFKNGGGNDQVKHTLTNQALYTISTPSSYIMDVEGDIHLDANGAQVYLKDNGATKYTFNMGTNQEIDVVGNLTLDVQHDITLDAGGGDVYLKDGGTQFARFQQANTNYLKMYVDDQVLFETKQSGADENKPQTTWNGSIFLDSALGTDITGLSVAGALNKLDYGQDRLQAIVDAHPTNDSATSFTSSYLTSTTIVPAIKEIANELYNSGVSFGNFPAGIRFGDDAKARLTANDFKAAILEIMDELGDKAHLENGTKFSTNTTSAYEALAELWDLVAALDSDATADFSSVNNNIGTLSNLDTTAKGNLVAAINELDADINTANTGIAARLTTVEAYTTADISEPANPTNKYFTNTRARGAVSASDAGGYGSFSYNSTNGTFTYTGPSNSNIHDRFEAGEGIDINNKTGDASKKIIKAETATSSNLGVAKFSTDNFSVSSGNVTIKNNGVAYAELQKVATGNRLLGATSDDTNVSEVQVATGMIKNDAVTYAKMQHVATANRVLGSTSANGAVTEVQVQTGMIKNDAVTQDKIADDAVAGDQMKSSRVLVVKNSAGTELFKMYGAGES